MSHGDIICYLIINVKRMFQEGGAWLTDGIKSENICWIISGLSVGSACYVFSSENLFVFSRRR